MKNNSPFRLWTLLPPEWRFALFGYLAFRIFYFLWSLLILTFYPLAVREMNLFGKPVLTVFDLRTSFHTVYTPLVEGRLLTFLPIHSGVGQIADLQTGTRWDVYNGKALSGVLSGRSLFHEANSTENIFPYFGMPAFPIPWLAVWQRFDTLWYVSIAERGYGAISGDIHFPPLYPMSIKLFMPIFGNGFVAAMLVSGLSTLICLKLLYGLFQEWEKVPGQESSGSRGWIYFLFFPTAFFLFGAYTEGLFIVTVILALRGMQKGQWVYSGIWISCATLIRLQGIALIVPLLYCMWNNRGTLRRLPALLGLGCAAVGVFIYLILRVMTGSRDSVIPLAESNLNAHLAFPWDNFIYAFRLLLAGSMTYIDVLNLLVALFFLGLIILGWKYIPMEYNLYLVTTYLILTLRLVDTQPLNSMVRYVLTLFPSFYVLGVWGKRHIANRLILYPSFVLHLFLVAQFWVWGWVA